MRKKLIEVALPLDAINRESAREKSIRHGHPSTLHLWWARRPLAACRAVLFASLVDDPSSRTDEFPTDEAQEAERERLFGIIERLVKCENSNNEAVLAEARAEILKSTDGNPPPVLDPFCGGGSIPLEAQRLGLTAYASDLNPVAVLITKALIEIPQRFAGRAPINPESRGRLIDSGEWHGALGLAEDIRYYGRWMRDEAEKRIGHLYPKAELTPERGGGQAMVVAWIWARTVPCPNPACAATMPLARSFWLSTKKGKETWVEPIIDSETRMVTFVVRSGRGEPPDPPKVGRGAQFRCLVCGQVAEDQHIKDQGLAGHMGAQMMAMVAEGRGGRIYLAPTSDHIAVAESAVPAWGPTQALGIDPRAIWCVGYGLDTFDKLFTPRQLVALTTFSNLVTEAQERVRQDAAAAGMPDDGTGLESGGLGATAYAEALGVYLACCHSAVADDLSSITTWRPSHGTGATRSTFARQGLPMAWDYAESNPFASASGDLLSASTSVAAAVAYCPSHSPGTGTASQLDATKAMETWHSAIVSTDPPYYDNIGYADLSDFFYVWLRRSLGQVFPSLFSTLLVPKAQELGVWRRIFGWSV